MSKKWFALSLVLFITAIAPTDVSAKPKSSRALKGCEMSRKGTKIRCPGGVMYLRQDVVERKIASHASGAKKKAGKKASKKRR